MEAAAAVDAFSAASGASAGLRAYGRTAQLALSPAQASVSLHDKLCQELVQARLAYQARRLDRMCRHTSRCMRTFLVLRNDLTGRSAGAGVSILAGFYLHMFQRLLALQSRTDVVAELDALIALMKSFSTKLRAEAVSARRPVG